MRGTAGAIGLALCLILSACGGTESAPTATPALAPPTATNAPAASTSTPEPPSATNTSAPPTDTAVPPPPTVAPEKIEVGGQQSTKSDLFTLAGGDYRGDWTASDASISGVGCFHSTELKSLDEKARVNQSFGLSVSGGGAQTTEGYTYFYNIPAGQYYIEANSGCSWTVTLARLTGAEPVKSDASGPLTIEGRGSLSSEPLMLSGGSYKVDWSAADASTSKVGCFHAGTLRLVRPGRFFSEEVGGGMVDGGQTLTGSSNLYNVKPDLYYLLLNSGCQWSITLTRQ